MALGIVCNRPVKAQYQGGITINADGSVTPSTAPIHQKGNVYTLTGNLNGSVIVEKDNIVFDGAGFTLQGSGNVTDQYGFPQYNGPQNETAISLTGRTKDTIENLNITDFGIGIALYNSSKCIISGNKLYNNNDGISLTNSWNNWIKQNDFENITTTAVGGNGSSNLISENRIVKDSNQGIFVGGSNDVISGNYMEANFIDIYVASSQNSIIGNNITGVGYGIGIQFVYGYVYGNVISKNWISNCDIAIWDSEYSNNNTIFENNIVGNSFAVFSDDGFSNETLFRNNFINNTQIVGFLNEYYETPMQYNSPQIIENHNWDNGTQGNYWSDYLTKYPAAKEVDSSGTYDTPYMVTLPPPSYPYIFYDYHPLIDTVEISQNVTELPFWTTPTPTLTPTNQAVPTSYVVIIVVVAVALAVFLISFLFYRNRRKSLSPTATVAAASGTSVVVVVGAGLLVCFKKRKH